MNKHIDALITRQENAFLTSIDDAGYPTVKVVRSPRKRDGLKMMYFTTHNNTQMVKSYEANQQAMVYFMDEARFQTASFYGTMTVETDPTIIQELMETENAPVFAKGVDPKTYCVLRFTADKVKFFSNMTTEVIDL